MPTSKHSDFLGYFACFFFAKKYGEMHADAKKRFVEGYGATSNYRTQAKLAWVALRLVNIITNFIRSYLMANFVAN